MDDSIRKWLIENVPAVVYLYETKHKYYNNDEATSAAYRYLSRKIEMEMKEKVSAPEIELRWTGIIDDYEENFFFLSQSKIAAKTIKQSERFDKLKFLKQATENKYSGIRDRIIECIQEFPCIYDKKNKDYLDNIEKQKGFMSIARTINNELGTRLEDKDIQKYWTKFSSEYKEYYNKLTQQERSGAGLVDDPKYNYFKSLHFLGEVINHRKAKSTLNQENRQSIWQNKHPIKRMIDGNLEQVFKIPKLDDFAAQKQKCHNEVQEFNGEIQNSLLVKCTEASESNNLSYNTLIHNYVELIFTEFNSLSLSNQLLCFSDVLDIVYAAQKRPNNSKQKTDIVNLQEKKESSISETSLRSLKLSVETIGKDDINFSPQKIGKGAFGSVQKRIWRSTVCAIKTVRLAYSEESVYTELLVMDKVKHPNVLELMAYAFDTTHCFIVMEYFESHNLRQLLFERTIRQQYDLDYTEKFSIAEKICSAISYLHDSPFKVIYNDIKPENILVNKSLDVRVCDMGSSLFEGTSNVVKSNIGTPKYMSPELIFDEKSPSIHSDVWAVACVIFELFSESLVWLVHYIEDLKEIYSDQKIPELSIIESIKERNLLKQCFDYEPTKRPRCSVLWNFFLSHNNSDNDSD